MGCETCAGYSSFNCPCCKEEPLLPVYLIDEGINAVKQQIQLKALSDPDEIETEILNWCSSNADSDISNSIANLIRESIEDERTNQ